MKLREMLHQLKAGSEFVVKRPRFVTYDVETAARGRALGTKRCNDDVTSGLDGMRDLPDIRCTVLRIGEEMEHRPVVPYVILSARACKRRHVAAKPTELVRLVTSAFLGYGHRGGRNIQD